jgi:hypothetical protein
MKESINSGTYKREENTMAMEVQKYVRKISCY